jgi:hypothetical protein
MPRPKKIEAPLKAKKRGQRPRCLHCTHELIPQYTISPPMPDRLADGRRKAEREAWEKANPPRFTGNYGRFSDNRFCGLNCGYNYAVAHTRPGK